MEPMQVAVRIRPMVPNELNSGCSKSLEKVQREPQIVVGHSTQVFTYDYVFDEFDGQSTIYNICVKPLISKLFEGYNATILAYGQTGTGKTFTMGTDYNGEGEMGVIPRAIIEIFNMINSFQKDTKYDVSVSFLELYNETLYDLLTLKDRSQSVVELRDSGSTIHIPGLTMRSVLSADQTLGVLKEGSLLRVTGATAMNATSSRSHAVFTVNIKITEKNSPKSFITSKFHLVDLAGSERAKKTGTTGGRFKEGVNINKGLLTLGNVISQLGDGTSSYINYRDSRLTRLLQDSLGGNSYTLMIACISPADINEDESLCTLRYADRVKKIKNKPVVNIDPQVKLISELKKEVQSLRIQIISTGMSGNCPAAHQELESQLAEELKKTSELTSSLKSAIYQNMLMHERTLMLENMTDKAKQKIIEMDQLLAKCSTQDDSDGVIQELHELVKDVQQQYSQVKKDMINHSKRENEILKESNEPTLEPPENIKEEYVMIQTQANIKIEEITKKLLMKQDLYEQLTMNSSNLNILNASVSVDTLKSLVQKLQTDKESLLKQLHDSDTPRRNNTTEFLDLKQKLVNLESELSKAQKKLTEQEKMLKMKEKLDDKITALQREIQSMKVYKVQLIHDMKRENEKFRNWQSQNAKEVSKLRSLTTKQNNQISRMEKEFTLRQAVLRRKLESAAAAKKRMEAAMSRRNTSAEKRQKDFDPEKLEEYISAEIEVNESYLLAKKSLQRLLDDRITLMKEMSTLTEEMNSGNSSDFEISVLQKRKSLLEDNLKLQSAQIADLQQRILDSKPDDLKKQRWDCIKSLVEAKFALCYIFNFISKFKKECINNNEVMAELKAELDEKLLEIKSLQEKLKTVENEKLKTCDELVKEYEDKIYTILSRQKGSSGTLKENRSFDSHDNVLKSISHCSNVVVKSPIKRKVDAQNSFTELPPHAQASPWLAAYEVFLNSKNITPVNASAELEEYTSSPKKVTLENSTKKFEPNKTFIIGMKDEETVASESEQLNQDIEGCQQSSKLSSSSKVSKRRNYFDFLESKNPLSGPEEYAPSPSKKIALGKSPIKFEPNKTFTIGPIDLNSVSSDSEKIALDKSPIKFEPNKTFTIGPKDLKSVSSDTEKMALDSSPITFEPNKTFTIGSNDPEESKKDNNKGSSNESEQDLSFVSFLPAGERLSSSSKISKEESPMEDEMISKEESPMEDEDIEKSPLNTTYCASTKR